MKPTFSVFFSPVCKRNNEHGIASACTPGAARKQPSAVNVIALAVRRYFKTSRRASVCWSEYFSSLSPHLPESSSCTHTPDPPTHSRLRLRDSDQSASLRQLSSPQQCDDNGTEWIRFPSEFRVCLDERRPPKPSQLFIAGGFF